MTQLFNNSKEFVVSGGSWTVIQGDSITYESRHAAYPTNGRAGIQGKLRHKFALHSSSLREVTSCSLALKMLQKNIAAGAMHNSKERHDAPKCHPDTRKAVLGDITSWVSDHSKETLILWLRAPAGSGKSAILQQIAENFQKSGGLSASFFFSRFAVERKTDTYLIATLASQIATSIPATRPFIEAAIERDPSIFQRVISEQMNHLVVYPLIYASLHPGNGPPWPTLLVIDGLDECDGKHQAEILRTLRTALLQLRTSLPTPLYLLIASRPEPAIAAVFDSQELSDITHHIVLDNSYSPNRDIATFLRSSFDDICRRRRAFFPSTAWLCPSNDVIDFLVKKSSGQFIFAATVVRFIDVDRRQPTAQLQLILDICGSVDSCRFKEKPFALLDEIYSRILNSSENTEEVISTLGVIFYLDRFRSPTPELIQGLLQLDPEDMTVMFWDLHSIIHIPDCQKDPIRFYHASFRDFLTDRHRSGSLYVDEVEARTFLLKLCIQTLSDFYGGSTRERTDIAVQYSRTAWQSLCELDGFDLDYDFLARVLRQFNPKTWLPLDGSAEASAFIMWWHDFAPFQENLHAQVSVSPIYPAQPSFTILTPSSSVPVPIQGNVPLYVFNTLPLLIGTLFTNSKNTHILRL
jgi:hypothetical protein